ncbi:hypothetical protein M409DRAFT_64909 [Zasmidium cellare ATCC 36951]|uniref:DNA replication factor Cdt1 C-terminal domain-containing protein n=1 Tax=Zasmidium cellare ATCC 36951 TaxID=1080233 RepID=A0A6A6CPZ6_ZASCE|nr:uncharacterized protein M409DRAFT_64909 [Zasmidium cellare ATCC 36951]KAF2169141.1 hypothetical protein M409DRAFT_64909 [Zasmidium cellare ATCC 36951]
MPGQRKRKNDDVADQRASKQARTAPTQKSISTFSTVGKPHAANGNKKQLRKSVQEKDPAPSQAQVKKVDKKRKRVQAAADEDEEDVIVVSSRAIAQTTENPHLATPRNKRVKNLAPPSPTNTPTRGAAALFDRLNIDANARAIPCAVSQKQISYHTPPHSPNDEKSGFLAEFPTELEELQDLHAAFLSALSLYYSHNGSASPVDMQTLLPQISQTWRKRSVKLDDLRRILAIVEESDRDFLVQDYGRAGICLVIAKPLVSITGRPALNINPLTIGTKFENALEKLWRTWQMKTAKENRTVEAFIDSLPLLDVTQNQSAIKAAPLFARGQQRLADLRASQTASKEASVKVPALAPSALPKSLQATQNRSTALLDRVLARQNLASTLPAGPTKDQMERKAALHRIENVTKVLSLLVGTKDRFIVSMPAITQQIQQSTRSPISNDEIERCLGLMATEVTPAFVKVVESGAVKAVVITRSGNVGLDELRARVEACL